MRKVLFVATVLKKHICQFHIPYLKWFHEQGYEVHVCARNDFDSDEDFNVPYCDKYYDVNFSRSPFDSKNIAAYHHIKNIIQENKYDLIHCHTPTAAGITRLAANNSRKSNKTVVLYTTHGFHFYKGSSAVSKLYYFAEKFFIKYTDGIITINHEDYEAAEKFCKSNICKPYYVHGMGVDTEKIASTYVDRKAVRQEMGIPEDAFLLLSVSEINKNKNLELTINAFSKITDSNVYYLICGSGNLFDYCHKLAADLKVSDRIIFAGYRYDIFQIVHIADVFLFPSLREGLGVAPLEAMSAGVPIIASDIRGVREYAVNMENSILLAPDDTDGYVNAINLLKNDHELRNRMGENARKSVEDFDLKKSVQAMDNIYSSYLGIDKSTEKEKQLL